MAGKNSDSSPQVTLGMLNDFGIGEVAECGDCFFFFFSKGMNKLCIPG
jgi:hypothetical protein